MAKAIIVCPLTGGACVKCSLYRGRHYNLSFSEHFQGIKNKKDTDKDLRTGERAEDQLCRITSNPGQKKGKSWDCRFNPRGSL
jgi:hypothetical protein